LTLSIFFCCIHFLSLLSPTLLVHHLSLFQESKSSKVVSAYATIGCCFQSLIPQFKFILLNQTSF
jgi:hypothetical protein